MKRLARVAAVALVAASCSRQPAHQEQAPEASIPSTAPVAPSPHRLQPRTQPAVKQPTIDPKSTEAAEELVRSFVVLINRNKFDEAYMLLGTGAPPRSEFDRRFSRYSDLHVIAGRAGAQEGAAGSIYLSVPLTISGKVSGRGENHSATAILRRVNDVPGSTEAQRHWHIERIEWGDAA